VVANVKVGVLSRPDMLSEMTGTVLTEKEKVEVVARFSSQRDGRVYLRLRRETGWVSTRSRKDLTKVILGPLDGEAAIELQRYAQPIESTASRMVPELDASAADEDAYMAAAEDLDADDLDLDLAMAEAGDAGLDEADAAVDEEEGADEDEEGDEAEDGEHEEEEEEEEEAEGEAADNTASASSPGKKRHYHKFKVVVGRCPVLIRPNAEELMVRGKNRVLQLKQEFISDGYIFAPSEGRTYLRLTRNRGWVCEQSRNDIRRAAIVPSGRKRQISKKMARAVAFRGGDTNGLTRLGKDDLIKNSYGKIVSKKASEAAKKKIKDNAGFSKWTQSVKRAREELGLTGFVPVKKGSPVYEKAKEIARRAS